MNKDDRFLITENPKNSLNYARKRMVIGAAIGFLLTLIDGYIWSVYKHNIPMKTGLNLFWYPFIGLGWIVLSFIGAVVGAIASLFTKKWKEKNL